MDAHIAAGVFPLIWLYAVLILCALAVLELLATKRLLVPSVAGFLEKAPAFRVTPGNLIGVLRRSNFARQTG